MELCERETVVGSRVGACVGIQSKGRGQGGNKVSIRIRPQTLVARVIATQLLSPSDVVVDN